MKLFLTKPADPLARLQFLYFVNLDTGCWEFTGPKDVGGYGKFKVKYGDKWRTRGAHRIMYELTKGEVSTALELDHLCGVRHCINPDHMEPVTPRENTLRSNGVAAKHAAKTHCIHGHPLSGENVRFYTRPNGITERVCRTCSNDAARAQQMKKKMSAC